MKNDFIKLNVQFFSQDSGKEPVREWLLKLSKEERMIVGQDIEIIQRKWPIGWPFVDHLGDGIWEVRSTLENRIARVLFYIEKNLMLLLHGFIKKTQKTPIQELNLAKKRLTQWKVKK